MLSVIFTTGMILVPSPLSHTHTNQSLPYHGYIVEETNGGGMEGDR